MERGEGVESSNALVVGGAVVTLGTKWLSYLNLKSFLRFERNVGFRTLSLERRRHLNRDDRTSDSESSSEYTALLVLGRILDIRCDA